MEDRPHRKKNGIKCRDYKTEHLSTKIELIKQKIYQPKLRHHVCKIPVIVQLFPA